MKIEKLTIEQYKRIQLIIDDFKDDENILSSEIIKYIHGNLDLPKLDGDKLIDEVISILSHKPDFATKFKYEGVEYGFLNLETMTTGEFIDLDNYMKDGKELDRMAAILYRPITETDGENYSIEKYQDTNKYNKIMLKVDSSIIIGGIIFFINFKKQFTERFPYLYSKPEPIDDDEEQSSEFKLLSEEEEFQEEFGWYSMLYQAANENYLAIQNVVSSPATEFLTYINFYKRKTQLDYKRINSKH